MQLEQRVLQQLLPKLVDMAADLKVLKQRFKDINMRVSALEMSQTELKELQRRVDAMGASLRPKSPPPPGIYS